MATKKAKSVVSTQALETNTEVTDTATAWTTPFADEGDRTDVPLTAQTSGDANWKQGYGQRYSLSNEEGGKYVERGTFNQILFMITSKILLLVEQLKNAGIFKKLDKIITYTVGLNGDFQSVGDAVEQASIYLPAYLKGNSNLRINIELMSDYVWSEQLYLKNLDLSYVYIYPQGDTGDYALYWQSASATESLYSQYGSLDAMISADGCIEVSIESGAMLALTNSKINIGGSYILKKTNYLFNLLENSKLGYVSVPVKTDDGYDSTAYVNLRIVVDKDNTSRFIYFWLRDSFVDFSYVNFDIISQKLNETGVLNPKLNHLCCFKADNSTALFQYASFYAFSAQKKSKIFFKGNTSKYDAVSASSRSYWNYVDDYIELDDSYFSYYAEDGWNEGQAYARANNKLWFKAKNSTIDLYAKNHSIYSWFDLNASKMTAETSEKIWINYKSFKTLAPCVIANGSQFLQKKPKMDESSSVLGGVIQFQEASSFLYGQVGVIDSQLAIYKGLFYGDGSTAKAIYALNSTISLGEVAFKNLNDGSAGFIQNYAMCWGVNSRILGYSQISESADFTNPGAQIVITSSIITLQKAILGMFENCEVAFGSVQSNASSTSSDTQDAGATEQWAFITARGGSKIKIDELSLQRIKRRSTSYSPKWYVAYGNGFFDIKKVSFTNCDSLTAVYSVDTKLANAEIPIVSITYSGLPSGASAATTTGYSKGIFNVVAG